MDSEDRVESYDSESQLPGFRVEWATEITPHPRITAAEGTSVCRRITNLQMIGPKMWCFTREYNALPGPEIEIITFRL